MIDFILTAFLAFILVIIIDHRWMKDVQFSKIEKGMEVLEHFHWGLILITIGIAVWHLHNEILSVGLLFAGFTFIACEAKQKNDFAIHSSHAKVSILIGIILTNIAIATYFYFPELVN